MKTLCIIGFAVLILTGCGKKGALQPLEESSYPRPYPKPVESCVQCECEQKKCCKNECEKK